MIEKYNKISLPKITIDEPKNERGCDLSDHFPIVIQGFDIKIISYNIQFMPTLIGGVEGKKKFSENQQAVKDISDYFASQDPDICCVQELFDNDANKLMEEAMLQKGYITTTRVGTTLFPIFNGGVCTFIKRKWLLELDFYELIYENKIDYLVGADALVNKGIIHICFRKEGSTYHVINTHLQASYSGRKHYAEVALAQCVELKNFIAEQTIKGIIGPEDKVIICGDFNIPKPGREESSNILYEKMQYLLGPKFTFLDYNFNSLSPKYTVSRKNTNNTYGAQCIDIDVNLDIAIIYNPKQYQSSLIETELSDIYCTIQLAVSRFVTKKATIFSNWLLSKENSRQLKQFNQQFNELIKGASVLKQQNKNPIDDKEWFKNALNLLQGPGKDNINLEFKSNQKKVKECIAFRYEEGFMSVTLSQCKEHFDKVLYQLKKLNAHIHKSYVHSSFYKQTFAAAIQLYHVLFNASNDFFKNPTPKSYQKFRNICLGTLNEAREIFANHSDILSLFNPILRGILGILAALSLIPALIVSISSPHGFMHTFFGTSAPGMLQEIKNSMSELFNQNST